MSLATHTCLMIRTKSLLQVHLKITCCTCLNLAGSSSSIEVPKPCETSKKTTMDWMTAKAWLLLDLYLKIQFWKDSANRRSSVYVVISCEWRCDDDPHIEADENADDSQHQPQGRCNNDPSTVMRCIDDLDGRRLT